MHRMTDSGRKSVSLGDSVTPLSKGAEERQHEMNNHLVAPNADLYSVSKREGRTALHSACSSGNLQKVRNLLDAGAKVGECDDSKTRRQASASINVCDESDVTPLMLAASKGCNEIVCHLLRAGAIVCEPNSGERTALHYACVSGHLEVVRILVDKEPSLINQEDVTEHTPLVLAASQGHHKVVEFLMTLPVTTVRITSKNYENALYFADKEGHIKVSDMLLEMSVDKCDESGLTPLMLAANAGHCRIVQSLLCAGAKVQEHDNEGRTALHYAVACEKETAKDVVKSLLKTIGNALIDHADIYGYTSVIIAAIKRHHAVAVLLVEAGACVTQLARYEERDLAEEVLSFANEANLVDSKSCRYLRYLFQQHSSQNLENWDDCKQSVATLILGQLRKVQLPHSTSGYLSTDPPMTELMWSSHKGYHSLVKYLILEGVDVNAQNPDGDTALHFAALSNHIQCGLLLAKAGADVRKSNKRSQTPFNVSSTEFRNGVEEMLSLQTPNRICCVLGNNGNGKSALIASLRNENASKLTQFQHRLFGVSNISQRTAGIEPIPVSSKHYGNVLFYDFAGRGEYHGPYDLFLESISRGSSSVAVIVVVNITEKESGISQQLNRWLKPFHEIPSTANPIPVILVGSYLDKAKNPAEAKRNLENCCQQLKKNQGYSVLLFGSVCCLDCRQPYASDIRKLCQYLRNIPLPRWEDSNAGYNLPWVNSQIQSSFTKNVLCLSEFATWIDQNKANLPTNLPPAEDVCKALESTGRFLYFSHERIPSDGWLVLDLPSILEEVYDKLLSSGKSEVTAFSLLSCTQLESLFDLDSSLVCSILKRLAFAVKVDPMYLSGATHLTKSTDHECEYLFIPALVTASQPNVFPNTNKNSYTFCWLFEVDKLQFLSPCILQAVILKLARNHVSSHRRGSEVTPIEFSVWLNGISWGSIGKGDVDVAVQITDSDNTTIHVIGYSEVSAEALCDYMSTVVQDIAATIRDIDRNIHGSVYIVWPDQSALNSLQFLLENPRSPAHCKYPVDTMLMKIKEGSENAFSHDSSNEKGGKSVFTGLRKRKKISELFGGFKPSIEQVKSFLVLQLEDSLTTLPTGQTQSKPNSFSLATPTGSTLTTPTGPSLTTPTGSTLTTLTGPSLTTPTGSTLTTATGSTLTTPIGPSLTTPTGSTLTTPIGPSLTTPTGSTLTTPIGPSLTTPTDSTLTTPTSPSLTTPTGSTLTTPIGPFLTTPTSSTLTTPTSPSLTTPIGPSLTTPTGSTLTTPTGPFLTTPTDPSLTTPTGPSLTTPTGPFLTMPTAPPVTTPTAPPVTTPTDPALTTSTGPSLTTPTGPIKDLPRHPLKSAQPDVKTLDKLVVCRVAGQWNRVGAHLDITQEKLKTIERDCREAEPCCFRMFDQWLHYKKGTGDQPRTWESVLSALEDADEFYVATDLRRKLNSDPLSTHHTTNSTPTGPTLTTPTDPALTPPTGPIKDLPRHPLKSSQPPVKTLDKLVVCTVPAQCTWDRVGETLPADTSTHVPCLDMIMKTLDSLVVHEVAAGWKQVGLHLGMAASALDIIQANYPSNVVQCCHEMFSYWLFSKKSTGDKLRTWETIFSALEQASFSNAAADLRRHLSILHSDRGHVSHM